MVGKSFGQKASQVEADRVKVTFGPEVTASLGELEKNASKDPKFDSDVLALLQGLHSHQPVEVRYAMSRIAMVIEEATESYSRTHDLTMQIAVSGFIHSLLGPELDSKTISITVDPKTRSHSPVND